MENNKEIPFACDLDALTKEQRDRYHFLVQTIKSEIQEIQELKDGFGVRFPVKTELIKGLAEFISYERLCCPFFDLEISVEREAGPLWLRLRGREGVKEFIRFEFGF